MEKKFYYLDLRSGVFKEHRYYLLDFLDETGNKYSVSCSSEMYDIIADMSIPKFALIDIRFSVIPAYGKFKVSVIDINFWKEV